MSSKAISTLPRICRCASSEMQTPPGSAMPSRRAAILTPSPKISLSSMMMSPTWMPMRNSIRLVLRHVGILLGHAALDLDGASHRIDGAGELDQHAVAGGLDDASAMLGDGGIEKRLSGGLQAGQRAFFVHTHQAAVSGDIRRQNCRKPPFHAIVGQNGPREIGKFRPTYQSTGCSFWARVNVRSGSKCEEL